MEKKILSLCSGVLFNESSNFHSTIYKAIFSYIDQVGQTGKTLARAIIGSIDSNQQPYRTKK